MATSDLLLNILSRSDKRALRDTADELDKVARKADDAGGKFDDLAKSSGHVDRQIEESRKRIKELGAEFDKTGEKGDVFKKLRSERGNLAFLEKIKKDMADVGAETDKTGTKMVNLAGDITKAKAALAEMGDEFRKTGKVDMDGFKTLTSTLRELERAKAAIGKLAPGDSGGGSGGALASVATLLGDIGRIVPATLAAGGSILDVAKGIATTIGKGIKDGAAALFNMSKDGLMKARDAAMGMFASIGDSISKNPIISTAIIAGVTVGIPVITGVIGSAVAAGVSFGFGAGAIAGGIALAAKDTRVGAAWGSLWETSMTNLESASSVFVDPLIRGASTVSAAWMNTTSRIGSAFHALAPLVDDLSAGAAGFLSNLGPGIDALTRAAGPFIADFAAWLPELGSHIADFAASVEKAGPGARAFFNDMLSLVGGVVDALGWLAEAGSRAYLYLGGVGDLASGKVTTGLAEMYSAVTGNTKAFGDAQAAVEGTSAKLALLTTGSYRAADGSLVLATNYGGLEKSLSQTAATADTVAGAMSDRMLNSMMSLDQATLGFAESQTRVTESIDRNGRALDIHQAKGQANREAILGAVQANISQYDANIRSGMSAVDAAKAYDTNTAALEGQLQKAHFTQEQIDGLIGKYRDVPKNVNTDIATKGLTEALGGLEDVIRKANGLDGRVVTMTLEEVHRTTYDSGTPPSQFFKGVASGGRIGNRAAGGYGGGVYNVGENGPEQVVLPAGAFVIPNHQLSGGRTMPTVNNQYSINVRAGMGADGNRIGAEVVEAIKQYELVAGTRWRS